MPGDGTKPPLSVRREGRVAIVTIDRGDGRNALSAALMRDLTALAQGFAADSSLSAIVLTGAGGFSAGADLKDPELAERSRLPLLARRQALRLGPDMCDAFAALEPVTVAAIEGFCIGGGVSLAVACDFRILGASAHLRLPEIPLGMNMSWHTLPRLVSLIGPARTKEMTLFGRRIAAATAAAWGLADALVADGAALGAAEAWAQELAALPPVALRMSKVAISQAAAALHAATSFMDLDQFALAASSEDHAEAVAAFLEKRPPRFTGA